MANTELPHEAGVCRFCLVEETNEVLFAPCSCAGSSRLVHPACLVRWLQKQPQGDDSTPRSGGPSAVCEVCKSPWRYSLKPHERVCWVRRIDCSPRYQAVDPDTVEHQAMLARMNVGALIVQAPSCAARNGQQVNAVSLAMEGNRRALSLFTAPPPAHGPGSPQRRGSEWHLSCNLVLHVEAGASSDGSDTIVAANLTRRFQGEEGGASNAPHSGETRAAVDLLRRSAEGVEVCALSGGPLYRDKPLCLLSVAVAGGPYGAQVWARQLDVDGARSA